MTDADCIHCGGDNLTDYPVCPRCAKRLHFANRLKFGRNCKHCDIILAQARALTTKPRGANILSQTDTNER